MREARVLISVLIAVGIAVSQTALSKPGALNFSGWLDTSTVAAFRADSLKYSKVFALTNVENTTAIVQSNDTSATGIANDSIHFAWGYRLGWPYVNFAEKLDTLWGQLTVRDSVINAAANYKNYASATYMVDTCLNRDFYEFQGTLDTAKGYSLLQWHTISPLWAPYIQFFAKGNKGGTNGNKIGSFVKLRFSIQGRSAMLVKQR